MIDGLAADVVGPASHSSVSTFVRPLERRRPLGGLQQKGSNAARSKAFIKAEFRNDEGLAKDARAAPDAFVKDKKGDGWAGDGLLNRETEAFLARRSGTWTTPVKLFLPMCSRECPPPWSTGPSMGGARPRLPRLSPRSCSPPKPRGLSWTTASGL
ncbi:hypothetical protein [Cyanobium sp. Morenito 9A2]|uniref:hypothetical protein n=1 Tax=Cyanobium sp. Morenito 9A2 TaxID=2823718 RepID=UPI0020CC1118|nr:hypothetical protein [Cyanobium sp. Morenito 9A2]MCP9848604.1 hypothetical protein [Cyanobium sp. Morenito 9A2]